MFVICHLKKYLFNIFSSRQKIYSYYQ